MSLPVWLCTWNMSNKGGDDEELAAIAAAVDPSAKLIVFGVQEAKRWGKHIMQRFAGNLRGFGPIKDAHNDPAPKVKIAKIKCCTKPLKFEFGYQGIGLLATADADARLIETGAVNTKGGSGKGGCYAIVQIGQAPVAFISAHLPTGSRNAAALQIYNHVAMRCPNAQATFFMGDLNYRLNLPPTGTERKLFKKDVAVTTTDQWVDKLADPAGRIEMGRLYDTMGVSGLADLGFTFAFPRLQKSPTDYSYPTYKRVSDKAGWDNPCYKLDNYTGKDPSLVKALIKEGWFGDKDSIKKKKPKAGGFDIGWLDRIGVKYGPAQPSAILHCYPPIALAGTYTSDHAPVARLVEIITNNPAPINM
jgi:hypothetical protein